MAKRPDISSPEKNAHTNFKLRAARQQWRSKSESNLCLYYYESMYYCLATGFFPFFSFWKRTKNRKKSIYCLYALIFRFSLRFAWKGVQDEPKNFVSFQRLKRHYCCFPTPHLRGLIIWPAERLGRGLLQGRWLRHSEVGRRNISDVFERKFLLRSRWLKHVSILISYTGINYYV
jgi:hypothetical protein